jgi:hypothetical protein
MGFDCLLRDTTSTEEGIGAVQGTLFRRLDHGNPSALICTKAGLLCTSELDEFGRRSGEGMRQADSEFSASGSHVRHIL